MWSGTFRRITTRTRRSGGLERERTIGAPHLAKQPEAHEKTCTRRHLCAVGDSLSQIERRKVPRYRFKAAAVVTEQGSSRIIVAPTSELSRFGCFVQTEITFPQGTSIRIVMTNKGATFAATGVATYVTAQGMGIVFITVEADDQEILEKWLADDEPSR